MGDYQALFSSISTVLMLAAAIYQAVLTHKTFQLAAKGKKDKDKLKRPPYWPLVLIVVIGIGIAWLPELSSSQIKEKAVFNQAMVGWGWNTQNPQTGFIRVDTHALFPNYHQYHMAGVAFHYDGRQDYKDVSNLSKSVLYDIVDQPYVEIIVPFNQRFVEEMKVEKHTNYALLLVPDKVTLDQFATLHQGESLGIKVVDIAAGTP